VPKHLVAAVLVAPFLILQCTTFAQAQDEYVYFVTIKQYDAVTKAWPIVATQTGFRLRHIPGIVTALHGVLVPNHRIEVTTERGRKFTQPLEISKVDVAHDIAVLYSEEFSKLDAEGFEQATGVDWKDLKGKSLKLIGYPNGAQRPTAGKVDVDNGPDGPLVALTRQVSPDLHRYLKDRKTPALDVLMLAIQGKIEPGHSGAPLLDSQNRVIAVGDGGFRGSADGWAVPWPGVKLNTPDKDPLAAVYQEVLKHDSGTPVDMDKSRQADQMREKIRDAGDQYENEKKRREPSVKYYANFVKRYGIPEGIGKLTPEEAQSRTVSYKFYFRGPSVENVEVVNGYDQLTVFHSVAALLTPTGNGTDDKRECKYEYQRDEDGHVVREIARDRMGEVVWSLLYTTKTTGQYTDSAGFARARSGSGAAHVVFTWSDEGFEREIRYMDRDGKPQPNALGVFGESRVHDANGLATQAMNIDADGMVMSCQEGYSKRRFSYDRWGNLTSQDYLDEQGRPALHRKGYARVTSKYDARGNLIEQAALGIDGRRVITIDGYSIVRSTYDRRGNRLTESYFGTDGMPVIQKNGYAMLKLVHDERGYETEASCFDTEGRPTLDLFGFSTLKHIYDDRGNMIKEACFGVDGRPIIQRAGLASITFGYDDRGNRLWAAYFGLDGRPTVGKDAYAKIATQYNQDGKPIAESYFDRAESPTLHREGYGRVERAYDNRGNCISESYFGKDGKLVTHKDGYAQVTWNYNGRGNKIEEAYFGSDGQRVLRKTGWAKMRMSYDARGYLISEKYFDANDKPTVDKEGRHELRWERDARGNAIIESYFDGNGSPTVSAAGFHMLKSEVDNRGNVIAETYLDTAKRPTLQKNGYAKFKNTYDNRGNTTGQVYLGLDDNPVLNNQGFASVESKFDSRSNPIEETYRDAMGRPILLNDGYAKATWVYDNRSNRIEDAFFDREGRPTINNSVVPNNGAVSKVQREHDPRGNVIKRLDFGKDGRLIASASGVAGVAGEYDERGNAIRATNLGVDSKPVVDRTERIAVSIATFDEKGNEISQTYLDDRGKATRHADGFTKVANVYDDRGNLCETRYHGPDGLVMHKRFGIAKSLWTFDRLGRVVQVRYYDSSGKLASHSLYGNAVAKFVLDPWGNTIQEDYYGPEESLAPNFFGVTRVTRTYDLHGNQTEEAFWNAAGGRVVHQGWKYAKVVRSFDVRGDCVKATFFDAQNRQVSTNIEIISVPDEPGRPSILKFGDVLISYKGVPCDITYKLIRQLRSEKDWDEPVNVSVRRDGMVETHRVTPRLLMRSKLTDIVIPVVSYQSCRASSCFLG
jgi:eukaryotic-like serine/threonine-protein kinase